MRNQTAAERPDSVGPNRQHPIGNGWRLLYGQNPGLERDYTGGSRGSSIPD